MNFPDNILEAKDLIQNILVNRLDCNCPVCGQFVKLYSYKLYSLSAQALIRLYQLRLKSDEKFHHIREYAEAVDGRPRASHFAELRFWKLIITAKDIPDHKKAAGEWAITNKGVSFVKNEITVPERVLVFNNTFYGHEGKDINIIDSLGNDFDYQELMNS